MKVDYMVQGMTDIKHGERWKVIMWYGKWQTLNIERDERLLCVTGNETDPLMRSIKKYSKDSNILII